ncbi:lipid A export permease/ATP-binding protein MsbA [Exilibacterium tricleocarpae]|uniref:Lipid A export permease/ATP-binding protein MsbA n=2 Tax=Exilibacterium tricleocarpae TaxID=2591008 RepID=A0A545TKB4_9GAMM|nr:lipid A export permease/ATP-binding protein MsbA [Exilibacterium tricleocarpae]
MTAPEQPGKRATYYRLLRYILPHLGFFLLSVFGFALVAASQAGLAELMKQIVNAIEGGDPSSRYFTPLLLVLIFFGRGVGMFIGGYSMARVAHNIVLTLRCQLFDRLTVLPGRYFDANDSGHLISRITYNTAQVTTAVTDALKVLIREGLILISLLIYLLWSDWKLTLVLLAVCPVIAAIVVLVGKRFSRLSGRIQVTMGDITQISSEMIGGNRVMRSFGGEQYEKERFFRASKNHCRQYIKLQATSSVVTPMLQWIVSIAMAVMLFVGLTFMQTGGTGEFMAYFTAAALIPNALKQLSGVYAKTLKGLVAAESIFLQLDEEAEEDSGTHEVDRVAGRIDISGVNFAYQGEEVAILSDINLSVEPGQTVALVGASGSGKSTLVSLIPRFYDYSEGSIKIDGVELRAFTLQSLRRQIALVNQNVTLFNATVLDNIAYGDLSGAGRDSVIDAARAAQALEFIEQLPAGLETVIGEEGERLSGGQRQRLAIARALLKDAPILILDEATSALDTESERKIQQALEEVMRGRTTLVVAHRLSTIENADKIVVMDAGRIVETGSHSELLARRGHYARLHAMQFQDAQPEQS